MVASQKKMFQTIGTKEAKDINYKETLYQRKLNEVENDLQKKDNDSRLTKKILFILRTNLGRLRTTKFMGIKLELKISG